ncbi:hypothetical protein TRIUR3_21366 [Triticum urartu]|uniref:Uncharacterized protein n=2 Tax=Triticum TaxID=4564 RepID=A0A9R0ZJT4_TRITD|nr:hypothetical protein TRIUR3_21366 [Triticum urartu]VAI78111.1 unnamed protein product [Triticum turgidum subsp. durum]
MANPGGANASFARATSTETRYTGAFSDENPNAACAIMLAVLPSFPSQMLQAAPPSPCWGRSSSSTTDEEECGDDEVGGKDKRGVGGGRRNGDRGT